MAKYCFNETQMSNRCRIFSHILAQHDCLEHTEHIDRQRRSWLHCRSGLTSGCFDAFCRHENVTIGIHYNELNSNWPPLLFSVNEETTNSRLLRLPRVSDTQHFGWGFWMESHLMSQFEVTEELWAYLPKCFVLFSLRKRLKSLFWTCWRVLDLIFYN